MARRTNVVLVDDLDESEASETVAFGLDGTAYEIDLNEDNAAQLRDAFAPYVGAARRANRGQSPTRRASRSTGGGGGSSAGSDREHTQAMREWARGQGMEVSERGRLSKKLVEAYEAAH